MKNSQIKRTDKKISDANGVRRRKRTQKSHAEEDYHIGSFDTEEMAARAYDNATYYLWLEGGFFPDSYTPDLNFPEDYKNPAECPAPYVTTLRLLDRIRKSRRFAHDRQKGNTASGDEPCAPLPEARP